MGYDKRRSSCSEERDQELPEEQSIEKKIPVLADRAFLELAEEE